MSAAGFDFAGDATRLIPQIRRAGLAFVGRYYSYTPAKNLTAAEALALSSAGVAIVSIWEAHGDQLAAFSDSQGTLDATMALQYAAAVGQPAGSAIYFAVDFDASEAQIASNIVPYFQAVGRALVGHYRVGVYGSGLVLSSLQAAALAACWWLAAASGWRGTFAKPHLRQGAAGALYGLGVVVDPDTALAEDYGGWMVSTPPAPPGAPLLSRALIRGIQQQLAGMGYYRGALDGLVGPQTYAALRAWQAAAGGAGAPAP